MVDALSLFKLVEPTQRAQMERLLSEKWESWEAMHADLMLWIRRRIEFMEITSPEGTLR